MPDHSDTGAANISDWIREQRQARNLTQADLGRILSVSTAAVASWENGTRNAKPKTLARFQEILSGDVPVARASGTQVNVATLKLTIGQAKEALARTYDVSPENIDITIRG